MTGITKVVRSIGVPEVILIESWRRRHNAVRPHAWLSYRPPAPEVFVPALAAWPAAQAGSTFPATFKLAPRSALNEHSKWTTKWRLVTAWARVCNIMRNRRMGS